MPKSLRIGLYGGTFDPLHNAHIRLAQWVIHELKLDCLFLIPAARHAFKPDSQITQAEIRYEMIAKTIVAEDKIKVSRIELDKDDVSYTVDTLHILKESEPFKNADLFLIIGADNINEFHLWKNPQDIVKMANVVVLMRPGTDLSRIAKDLQDKILFLDSPQIDISSTLIRAYLQDGRSISHLVPPPVADIIHKYNLYV